MLEIETKIIGFDERAFDMSVKKGRLEYLGKVSFRRWIFNISKSKNHDEFIRVRTDGKTTTLTYKYRDYSGHSHGLKNTEEIEVGVDDCGSIVSIMSKLFKDCLYQENVRKIYRYKGAEVTVNYWPRIPPVMEIEGKTEAIVKGVFAELNVGGVMIGNVSYDKVYRRYGIDLSKIRELKL